MAWVRTSSSTSLSVTRIPAQSTMTRLAGSNGRTISQQTSSSSGAAHGHKDTTANTLPAPASESPLRAPTLPTGTPRTASKRAPQRSLPAEGIGRGRHRIGQDGADARRLQRHGVGAHERRRHILGMGGLVGPFHPRQRQQRWVALVKYGSHKTISRVCWPAVTMSGMLPLYAATRLPIALPVPAPVCTLTTAGLPVDCANPSAIASTDASCNPRTYVKSSGKFFKNVSSVEPGLPNTVVNP